MISLQNFKRISEWEWELPTTYRADMRVPVRVFASRRILEQALKDASIEQAVNASTLPGIVGRMLVMPDVHQGYGFPIGGVAATALPDGMISPGGIGYDINCGVRLLATSIPFEDVQADMHDLAVALDHFCPSGMGKDGGVALSATDLEQVCRQGARWALKNGMATEQDLRRSEEGGMLKDADPARVSSRALERGRTQLGTLGSGNHFIEVDVVEQIFDPEAAAAMGLFEGCLTLMIHCGSRGLGHQVCTDYVRDFQGLAAREKYKLPDRELVCAPLSSAEGQAYLQAMRAAANFAYANRQVLAHRARQAFEQALAGRAKNIHLHQVYDISHNMGKIETHFVDGKEMQVCVHRKGATRAFGPGAPGLPEEYSRIGQPVIIPGSMGTGSWVLVGTEGSMQRSFGSSCHGAGRMMSRSQAKKEVRGETLLANLKKEGIIIMAGSVPGLAEEAPQAYKDVDGVVETVSGAGMARKVARLRPVIVVKG